MRKKIVIFITCLFYISNIFCKYHTVAMGTYIYDENAELQKKLIIIAQKKLKKNIVEEETFKSLFAFAVVPFEIPIEKLPILKETINSYLSPEEIIGGKLLVVKLKCVNDKLVMVYDDYGVSCFVNMIIQALKAAGVKIDNNLYEKLLKQIVPDYEIIIGTFTEISSKEAAKFNKDKEFQAEVRFNEFFIRPHCTIQIEEVKAKAL